MSSPLNSAHSCSISGEMNPTAFQHNVLVVHRRRKGYVWICLLPVRRYPWLCIQLPVVYFSRHHIQCKKHDTTVQ